MSATSARTSGTLFIIATPIGNLHDISFRAIATLKEVDVILAEDTRHTQRLLSHYGIKKPLLSFHLHNEANKAEEMVHKLIQGQSCALVSDAGTPLISDPGYPLVSLARSHGITVTPIPGACAFIAALSAAGVPCDALSFFGFLPAKATARRDVLSTIQTIEHTVVFYESTHRIQPSIEDIGLVLGQETEIILAKELTKTFEQFIAGTTLEVIDWLQQDLRHEKGEFVLIIPPRKKELTPDATAHHSLLKILLDELPVKQAVKLAVKITGQPKNELYKIALCLEHHDTTPTRR